MDHEEVIIDITKTSELRNGNLLKKIRETRYQQQLLIQGRSIIDTISETDFKHLKPEFQLALSNIESLRETKEQLLINLAGISGETHENDPDKGQYISQRQERVESLLTKFASQLEALRSYGISPQVIDQLIKWPDVRSLTNPGDAKILRARMPEIQEMITNAYAEAQDKDKTYKVNDAGSAAFTDIMALFDTIDKIELTNDGETRIPKLKNYLINHHNHLTTNAFKTDQDMG